MLVAEPGEAPALLDFFVAAPGEGADAAARAPLVPAEVFFEAAAQVFHVGAASCGVYGTPAGICEAHRRFATLPLADLVAPGAALARAGVELNAQQAYIFALLEPITASSPGGAREVLDRRPRGARGRRARATPSSPTRSSGSARRGRRRSTPATSRARRASGWRAGGGTLTEADLAGYEAIAREPIRVGYRGYDVFTNPPPSAGGILIASVLAQLDREPGPPTQARLRRGDGAGAPGAHAGVHGGPRPARLPRGVHGLAARLDHAHLGARRRRPGVRGDVHERRGLGHRRARHRHPPQQHDGRGGPLAARASSPTRSAAGCRR